MSWDQGRDTEATIWGTRGGFRLELMTDRTKDGTLATHMLLSYGQADGLRATHLKEHFRLRSQAPPNSQEARGYYYPVLEGTRPEEAELGLRSRD